VAIVLPVFDAFTKNDLLLSMMSTLVGDDVDLEPAEKAFEVTRGDFRAKFTAAVQARLAQLVVPEVFIELPEHPEQLRKADLEALVRQAPHGSCARIPARMSCWTRWTGSVGGSNGVQHGFPGSIRTASP
jgi:hypothetical protein